MTIRFPSMALAAIAFALARAAHANEPLLELEPPPGDYQYFGHALATFDDRVLVGAPANILRLPTVVGPGAAYLFDDGGTLLRSFTSPAWALEAFGSAVAGEGNLVAVGAPFADVDGKAKAGRAYLFDATTGELLHVFTAPSPTAGDGLGSSVLVVGGNVVVGSPGTPAGGTPGAGAAYLFDGTTGELLRVLTTPGGARGGFGYSLAALGDKLLVGAPFFGGRPNAASNPGRVFLVDPATGAVLRFYKAAGSGRLGYSLAVLGGNFVAGAPTTSSHGVFFGGSAYLFDGATGALLRELPYPEAVVIGSFGVSVAAMGSDVLVGALYEGVAGQPFVGAAYLLDSATGQLKQKFRPEENSGYNYFGVAVAGLGGNAIVGSPGSYSDSGFYGAGYAFVFATCQTIPEGGECHNADLCTEGETCQSGVCSGGHAKDCSAPDQCRLAGTCEPIFGQCRGGAPKPDETPCSAGEYICSIPDLCFSGHCYAPGGGDNDADGVCAADDTCGSVGNPDQSDLDGDGLGDVCDSADLSLQVRDVRLGPDAADRAGGILQVRADLIAAGAADAFSATQGLAARLTDGASLERSFSWPASECSTSPLGRIRCRRTSGPLAEAVFRPLAARGSGELAYRLKLRLAGVKPTGPVTAPVWVLLADRPGVLTRGIDRVGNAGSCHTDPPATVCTNTP